MAKATFDSPIFSLTPAERMEQEAKAAQNIPQDPDILEMADGGWGSFYLGARTSATGAAVTQLMDAAESMLYDDESDPVNFLKDDYNPVTDPLSFGMDNNPRGIAKLLENVPYEQYPYLLSSANWNDFQRRRQFIVSGLPEAQQYGSSLGVFTGAASDISAMVSAGLAAEPIALANLGVRTTLAGRAAAASLGSRRVQAVAEAAGEAAATISRTNLAARYTAMGIAEEAVFQSVKNKLDPLYSPDASDVVYQLAFSGGLSGLVGGAMFGRTFVREQIEDAAAEFRRLRTTNLPGGYTITWGDSFKFNAPAAADQMLFAPGALSMVDETRRVGRDLFFDWKKRADLGVVDTNIPGTRTLPLGEVPIAGAPRPVRSLAEEIAEEAQRPLRPTVGKTAKPTMGVRSAIKAAAFELSLAGVELTEETFAMLGRALVNTNGRRLQAGGFNKAFWEEVSSNLPPEVVARIRPVAERAFIPGIDRTVMDAVVRDDMVSEIWNHFRAGTHMDPANEKSLIFQVLQEIRDRGGMVNRRTVEDVVDRLREISQKPPKRTNAKGKEVLDANARRLAVIRLINEKAGTLKRGATGAKPIYIPNSLLMRMGGGVARGLPPTGATGLGGPGTPMGGPSDFSDVPVVAGADRLPGWSTIGNQSARSLESNNGAARLIGWLTFNARRSLDKAQAATIFETGTMFVHKNLFMFGRGYRNGFIKFALGDGNRNITETPTMVDAIKTAFGTKSLKQEFHKRVAQQLRTGAFDDSVEAVNEAARGVRELFNNIHSVAAEVGLPGFTKSATLNYMPRLWRFDKIRRLATTEQGKQNLVELIKTSIDKNGRRIVVDGVEQTITGDIDQAAKVFANRLIDIAQKTENAPMLAQEQELADALKDLVGPIKPGTTSRTPFGRARVLLDETASVRSGSDYFSDGAGELSIASLTNDDLPFVFKKYLTSVMGAVNERRLLSAFNAELKARNILGPKFTTRSGETLQDVVEVDTVEQMFALARKIGGKIEESAEAGLREIIAAMRYEPIHQGTTGLGDRILGVLLPYGYLTTGGQFGLAAISEIARVVGTLGIKATINQMPVLAEMISNWRNLDRPAQNFTSWIDSWLAPSTDRLRRSLFDPAFDAVQMEEAGRGVVYSTVKRGLDSASNLMSDITGLAPITSFTQQLTAATTLQHLYDVAKAGTKRLDKATVRSLGLEPEQYEQIIRFVGDNAQIKEGVWGSRIVGMNNLDNVEMDLVRNFVNRMVRTRIQDVPTRGDFHKLAFTFWGRLLTQFRTFNLKGVDNFLMQNSGRVRRGGGAKVAQEIMFTSAMAGLIQYGRTYADWASYKAAGNQKKMEETERNLGLQGFVRAATTGPAEFFLLTNAIDAVYTRAVSPDPIFASYRYSGLDWWGFPGQAVAKRALDVAKDVYGTTVAEKLGLEVERDITQSTIHRMRLLLPGQNIPILKQYLNLKEEDIATEWNLQRQQPRRPRD